MNPISILLPEGSSRPSGQPVTPAPHGKEIPSGHAFAAIAAEDESGTMPWPSVPEGAVPGAVEVSVKLARFDELVLQRAADAEGMPVSADATIVDGPWITVHTAEEAAKERMPTGKIRPSDDVPLVPPAFAGVSEAPTPVRAEVDPAVAFAMAQPVVEESHWLKPAGLSGAASRAVVTGPGPVAPPVPESRTQVSPGERQTRAVVAAPVEGQPAQATVPVGPKVSDGETPNRGSGAENRPVGQPAETASPRAFEAVTAERPALPVAATAERSPVADALRPDPRAVGGEPAKHPPVADTLAGRRGNNPHPLAGDTVTVQNGTVSHLPESTRPAEEKVRQASTRTEDSTTAGEKTEVRFTSTPRAEGRGVPGISLPQAVSNTSAGHATLQPAMTDAAPAETSDLPARQANGAPDSGPSFGVLTQSGAASASAPNTTAPSTAAAPAELQDRPVPADEAVVEANRSATASANRVPPAVSVPLAAAAGASAASLQHRDGRSEPSASERIDCGADPFAGEPRVSETTGRAAPAQTAQAAGELPRSAVLQIAEAMRGGASTIDLTLSPEELGRVKLSLGTQDGVLNVIVHADRPETADLIRRSLDLLMAEARDEGFETVSFSFGGTGQDSSASDDGARHRGSTDPVKSQAPSADTSRAIATRGAATGGPGLDLRL